MSYDVSVLIPSYKSHVTIGRAIRSALNQETEFNGIRVQVVVVDDCPEEPTKIPGDLREKIKSIQKTKNGGLAEALNTALEAAEGEYCIVLAADDWLEAWCLRPMVDLAEKWAGYFVVGGTKYWGQRSDVVIPAEKPDYTKHNAGLGAMFYPRSAWQEGLRYHTFEAAQALEDWDFALQLVEKGFLARVYPHVVLNYVLHGNGLHAKSIPHEVALLKELKARHPQVTAEAI
jgi:glycosyltransferase involved in cell wall biosynthesis